MEQSAALRRLEDKIDPRRQPLSANRLADNEGRTLQQRSRRGFAIVAESVRGGPRLPLAPGRLEQQTRQFVAESSDGLRHREQRSSGRYASRMKRPSFATRSGIVERRRYPSIDEAEHLEAALSKADIEPTRKNGMHALRHCYPSVLLDAGESIRTLADYLGHADPGFTLRVYTHLMPSSEDRPRSARGVLGRAPRRSRHRRGRPGERSGLGARYSARSRDPRSAVGPRWASFSGLTIELMPWI